MSLNMCPTFKRAFCNRSDMPLSFIDTFFYCSQMQQVSKRDFIIGFIFIFLTAAVDGENKNSKRYLVSLTICDHFVTMFLRIKHRNQITGEKATFNSTQNY